MRLTVRHSTRYSYEETGSFAVQRLRLTPPDTRGQKVISWTISAEGFSEAAAYTDGFGNRTHLITHCKPYHELTITAEGEVETQDTGGVIGATGETANPFVFLRATPLTETSEAIGEICRFSEDRKALDSLHELVDRIAGRVVYMPDSSGSGTTAAQAFASGRGVCQDHAHIFIAAARRIGVPARYVTGYLHVEGEPSSVAHHAWAEAFLPDLGWVGFDPSNRVCPTERYVRLACGFDASSTAPITGTRRGGGAEALSVDVRVQQQQQQQ